MSENEDNSIAKYLFIAFIVIIIMLPNIIELIKGSALNNYYMIPSLIATVFLSLAAIPHDKIKLFIKNTVIELTLDLFQKSNQERVNENPLIPVTEQEAIKKVKYSPYQNSRISNIIYPGEKIDKEVLPILEEAKNAAENENINKAKDIYDNYLTNKCNLHVLNEYGKLLFRIGELENAEEIFDKITEISILERKLGWTSRAFANVALVYMAHGELNTAYRRLKTSRRYNRELNHKLGIADNLRHLADIERIWGVLEKSEKHYNEALVYFEEEKDDLGIADTCSNLAKVYKLYGQYKESIELQTRSLVINKDIKYRRRSCEADNYSELGSVYRIQGKLSEAKEHFLKSLTINQNLCRKHGTAENLGRLGLLNLYLGDYVQAEKELRRAYDLNKELDNIEENAKNFANLGRMECYKSNFNAAGEYLKKALKCNKLIKAKEGIANVYYMTGSRNYLEREFTDAAIYTNKALSIWDNMNNIKGQADCNELLGLISRTKEEYESAIEYCNASIKLSNNIGARLSLGSATQSLGFIYEKYKKIDLALEQYKSAKTIFEQNGEKLKQGQINKLITELEKEKRKEIEGEVTI